MALPLLNNEDSAAAAAATTVANIGRWDKKKSSVSCPIFRWTRQSTLGSGSYGTVSLAIDLDDGFMFAVKSTSAERLVHSYRKAPPPELTALESEISILRSLDCAHIISYLGHGISFDSSGHRVRNLYLEYMEGGSVCDLVKRCGGCLQEEQVRRFTRDVVEGLTYLHAHDIVHCDIKGQNLLIGGASSSVVKIADFGLARKLSEDVGVGSMLPSKRNARGTSRSSSDFKGTPFWMAPEALQGVEQSFPSDIWSLGCTVVKMYQGCPPWANLPLSFASLVSKISCSDENPPLPADISEEGKDFLDKCFERDCRKRWTASQLLHHPFLKVSSPAASAASGLCPYTSPPSPRSTLDAGVLSGGGSLSMDSEDEDCFATAMSSLCV